MATFASGTDYMYLGVKFHHKDFVTAFLNGDIDAQIYVEIPDVLEICTDFS